MGRGQDFFEAIGQRYAVLFPQAGVCRRNLDPGRAQREIHSMMKRECRKLRRSRCATRIIAESKK